VRLIRERFLTEPLGRTSSHALHVVDRDARLPVWSCFRSLDLPTADLRLELHATVTQQRSTT
jgi:hypothetical protein